MTNLDLKANLDQYSSDLKYEIASRLEHAKGAIYPADWEKWLMNGPSAHGFIDRLEQAPDAVVKQYFIQHMLRDVIDSNLASARTTGRTKVKKYFAAELAGQAGLWEPGSGSFFAGGRAMFAVRTPGGSYDLPLRYLSIRQAADELLSDAKDIMGQQQAIVRGASTALNLADLPDSATFGSGIAGEVYAQIEKTI